MRFLMIAMVAVGCANESKSLEAAPVVVAHVKTTCTAVEGEALGRLPLTIQLGDEAISFAEWSLPDERSTSVVGFAAHLPGGVSFTVKAGDEEFRSAAPRWHHPRGVSGPRVRPVERITFCRTSSPPVVASR